MLYPLSYGGARLPQQRERREGSPQHLFLARRAADGHELTRERRVRLLDAFAGHACELQASRHGFQGALVGNAEHDGMRAVRKVSRARLPCGVNKVRGEDSEWQVLSDDNEMTEAAGFFSRAGVTRFSAWSCS